MPTMPKEYMRSWRMSNIYDIDCDVYDAMLLEQGMCCAICGSSEPKNRWGRFVVDHDHETGKVRGLLCNVCNVRLGVIENAEWMAQAAEYLR
jgi:hypothetical protein